MCRRTRHKGADWMVCMRALDLLEKRAHEHAEWVARHRDVFLGVNKWEVASADRSGAPALRLEASGARARGEYPRSRSRPSAEVRAPWALDSLARSDLTISRVSTLFVLDGFLTPVAPTFAVSRRILQYILPAKSLR